MGWGGGGGGGGQGGGGKRGGSPQDKLHKHWMLTAEMCQVEGARPDTEDEVTQ